MKNKVKVRIPARNEVGKIIKNEYTYITGICKFYGYNAFLEVEMIVVDRTPIFPIIKEDVEFL